MNLFEGFDSSAIYTAIIMENRDSYAHGIMKCYVPAIMPSVPMGKPKDVPNKISKTHIKNKDKNSIIVSPSIIVSNYINIDIPRHVWQTMDYDADGTVAENSAVLIAFIGGDINNIKVIGRC